MLAKPTANSWSESNSTSLHQTQCGSVGYELKVKLTWEQVESLQVLLDHAVSAAQLVDDPETVRQWLAAYEGTNETT